MKPIIMDMKEMSDSTQVYASRPNPFLAVFIWLLMLMAASAVCWMSFFKVECYVRGTGTFQMTREAVSVSSRSSGVVETCSLEEGRYVRAGELLFSVDGTPYQQKLTVYRQQQKETEEHICILKAYLASLEEEDTLLDSQTENRFYSEIMTRKALFENAVATAGADLAVNADDERVKRAKEQVVLTEKQAVQSELFSQKASAQECSNKVLELETALADCTVRAPADGYISMEEGLQEGDYIQQGMKICRIVPETSESCCAEVYISNQDIGKLREGQTVKLEATAYPVSEYGDFTGTIETIAKDIRVSSTGTACYLVRVHCDSAAAYSQKGEKVQIINGMACQAKVVTDTQSVLQFLLQKINLLDK